MSTTILTDEQIEKARQNSGANCWAVTPGATERFAGNIEQAVLQSEQVQALRKDAERLDWLADPNNSIGNVQLPTKCVTENPHCLRAAIDAAMQEQKT